MSKANLEKQSSSLLTRMISCAGINVLCFLGVGFYVLTMRKKIANSGIEQVDPLVFTEQMDALRLSAIFGFVVATLPLLLCIFFALKRTKVLKELAKTDDDLLEGQNVK